MGRDFQTDAELKEAYAKHLKQAGKGVSVDVPIGEQGGTVDILTECEIIFCAVQLNRKSALLMKSKLDFISRFSPSWQQVVVVQGVAEPTALSLLSEARIQLINSTDLLDSAWQKPKVSEPKAPIEQPGPPLDQKALDRASIYAYPALDSVKGADGFHIALLAIGAVIMAGVLGTVVSFGRSPEHLSPTYLQFPWNS